MRRRKYPPCVRFCREGMRMAKKKTVSGIPDHEIEALARCLLPSIRDYFESAEGKR